MAPKFCLTHEGVTAVTMCRKCHRPICQVCVVKDDDSLFCSERCLEEFQAFQKAYLKPKKRHGIGYYLYSFFLKVVLFVVCFLVFCYWGKSVFPALAAYDFVGKFLITP
jgi:hypothetical protein